MKVWIVAEQMYDWDDIHTVFSSEEECMKCFEHIKEDYRQHWRWIDDEWEKCFRAVDRAWVYVAEHTVFDSFKDYFGKEVLHLDFIKQWQ